MAAVAGGDVDVDFVDEHQFGTAGALPDASSGLFDRMDADEAAVRAVILELDRAVDLREQRVVLAEADVEAGLEPAAALADQNRSAGHQVAVVALDAQPLRVAVAAVAGAA